MKLNIRHALQTGVCGLFMASAACSSAEVEAPTSVDGLTAQVNAAIAEVSDRTGVAKDAITVNQASIVNWGSGAVGCPEPGMNYTQAIVPGILIVLTADGELYRYHGRAGGKVFYCPNDRAEAPAFGPGEEFM